MEACMSKQGSSQAHDEFERKVIPTKYDEKIHSVELSDKMAVIEDSENLVESVKRVKFEADIQKDCGSQEQNVVDSLHEMNIPSGKWLHMENIEKEKLQWMVDVNATGDDKHVSILASSIFSLLIYKFNTCFNLNLFNRQFIKTHQSSKVDLIYSFFNLVLFCHLYRQN